MTPREKNVAYVVALAGVILLSVPATRDFIVELTMIIVVMVYFGLLVLWHWLMSISWTIITGVVLGVIFTTAAVIGERDRARNR